MAHYTTRPLAPNVDQLTCEHCPYQTISPREMALHLEYVHKIKAEPEAEPVVKPKRILEIGTRTGLSIAQLLSAFLDHSNIQEIILCDLFNDGLCTPNLVLNNLRYLNLPTDKISFITGDSLVEIPKLFGTKMFDYILVDGGHDKENARQDLHNATQLIDRGGHIVFDDITPDGCNLQDVWDEFKNIHFHEFHYYENHDGKGIGVAVRL